jgi:hypothetical protein
VESNISSHSGKKKRRRAKCHKEVSWQSTAPVGAASTLEPSPGVGTQSRVKTCVLEFSTAMAREEAALRRALFVSIVGSRPEISGAEVRDEVARAFGIDVNSISIHQSLPEDFLLLLPDESSADRVFSGGKLFRGPLFNLQFRRWSRLAHAEAARLPALVEVEVHGIPAHAWDRSTVEYLLRDSCIITDIHPSTSLKNDLSSFRLRAWCLNTDLFPRPMKLLIVEPGTDVQEKRCLSYDIEVAVTAVMVPTNFDPPPAHSPAADGRDRHEDGGGRHSDDSNSPRPDGGRLQRPIFQRLGPRGQSTSGGRGAAVQRCALSAAGPAAGIEVVASPTRLLDGSPLSLTIGAGAEEDLAAGIAEVRRLHCPLPLLLVAAGVEEVPPPVRRLAVNSVAGVEEVASSMGRAVHSPSWLAAGTGTEAHSGRMLAADIGTEAHSGGMLAVSSGAVAHTGSMVAVPAREVLAVQMELTAADMGTGPGTVCAKVGPVGCAVDAPVVQQPQMDGHGGPMWTRLAGSLKSLGSGSPRQRFVGLQRLTKTVSPRNSFNVGIELVPRLTSTQSLVGTSEADRNSPAGMSLDA